MTFDQIVTEIKAEFPSFKLIVKGDSKLMKLLYYVTLMFWWSPTYMTNFTTVFGRTVYMPQWLIGTDTGVDILRHERVHMRDCSGWNYPWYCFTYMMLPIGPSGKAYWELRGYKESMQATFDRTGAIPDSMIEFVADEFTSSKYLWMWPFPTHIRKILNRYRNEIYLKKIPLTII